MHATAAAGLLAVVGLFDLIGTLGSGWLTDRFDPRKLLAIYYGFRSLALFALPRDSRAIGRTPDSGDHGGVRPGLGGYRPTDRDLVHQGVRSREREPSSSDGSSPRT